jgi:hypothetical protein
MECNLGSAQESVDGSDFMDILGSGDFVYTGWHEGERLDQSIGLAWV